MLERGQPRNTRGIGRIVATHDVCRRTTDSCRNHRGGVVASRATDAHDGRHPARTQVGIDLCSKCRRVTDDVGGLRAKSADLGLQDRRQAGRRREQQRSTDLASKWRRCERIGVEVVAGDDHRGRTRIRRA